MSTPGEPDSGVSGNYDLGRLFALMIQGQQNTNRVMNDLLDTTRQSLHAAQTFGTGAGPSNAYRARQTMGGASGSPGAGQTTQQTLRATQGTNGVFTVGPAGPSATTPPGSPQAPSGAPGPVPGTQPPSGGNNTPAGPSQSFRSVWGIPTAGQTMANNLPRTGSAAMASLQSVTQRTMQQTSQNWNRSLFGVWSPYWQGGGNRGGGGGGGGNPGGGGGGGWGNGGGGQLGMGPYGMGPAGMPPNPIYFGGPNSPHGPYGPYGPYGAAGGGGSSLNHGSNHGQGAGGGHLWGMGSGIGGWLRNNIPGLNLVDKAFGEVKSQRNKNEYYQNVNGGSNFGGFAERFHEEAYVASTTAMLGDQEARQAFKGVTRLGYNGIVDDKFSRQGGRQDALNFIYHGKTSYGASVAESLQELEVVSKNSTLSLKTLQGALKDVSDTAGKAGVNAQMARKQLMGLVSEGTQAGYGSGSVTTAANIQMGKTSLGRSFQDVDLSGQMSQQYTYMASSQMGMTYNQYTAMQSVNPLAAAQARAGQNLSVLSQIFTQDEVNWVKQKAQSLGGTLDSDAALSIVPEFLTAFPNHNISVIQSQLAAFGIIQTDDPQKALAYAFSLMAGNNGDLANAEKTSKQNKPLSEKQAAKQGDRSGFIQDFSTGKDEGSSWGAKLGGAFVETVTAGIVDDIGTDKGDSSAMTEYKSQVKKTKVRNPVLENLLTTVKDDDDTKVIVHTSKGERVVSLKDAIKNHPTELSSGSAKIVSGDKEGKTVSDVLGAGAVNTGANWTEEAAKAKGKEGESLKSWQKENPDKSAKGSGVGANGKVVIDLSDAAKQLFKVSSATGIAGANGEGAPPLNYYNWNANR